MTGNREYKSDVFSMLMEEPENALSLYNAINGSNYADPAMVEFCTLDRGISLSVRNDAAFVDYVRNKYNENDHKDLEYCIEWAIDHCIEENVLRDFLIRRRTEVMKVMTLDYTFDRRLMMAKRDSREEGRAEGFSKLIAIICKKLQKNKSIEDIAEDLEEEVEEIAPICRIAEQFAPEYDPQQVLKRFLEVQALK